MTRSALVIPGGCWPGIHEWESKIMDSPPETAGNDDIRLL